jgi:hypothetical protein
MINEQIVNYEPQIYKIGNPWQKKVYIHMAEYIQKKGIVKFGVSKNGNQYKHLLTKEDAHINFITKDILDATKKRFNKHKAGDINRILTNTAASQTYCFNLVIFLQQNLILANRLFSDLLNKNIEIQHLEPEFTPNECDIPGFERTTDESIGDQNHDKGIGTDSDIAVFYTYENNKKGVLLIEFKFIEPEFSVCSSFTKKKIKNICFSPNYYSKFIQAKETDKNLNFLCGYNKYYNWDLTTNSKVVNIEKIKSMLACPFRNGLNQLWRNYLLSEQVALARNCDEFGFWVFTPIENDKYLWKKGKTEKEFREILTKQGNEHFRKIYLETILDKFKEYVNESNQKEWLSEMNIKYRI